MAGGLVCFFFQAEDGIRDLTVTGVQTCALPISPAPPVTAEFWVTQTFNGLSYGALLFLLASGLSLIFGVMRVVNLAQDRKSVVKGKSVDLGGRRIIKKKKNKSPH